MGHQFVTVILVDGRKWHRVAVVDGLLTAASTDWTPPFTEAEIDRLVVTHDRSGPPVEE